MIKVSSVEDKGEASDSVDLDDEMLDNMDDMSL